MGRLNRTPAPAATQGELLPRTDPAAEPDPAAEYVIGPATANRYRSVYRVADRRGEELALRLVGVLLAPRVVQRRDQVLPGDTWMPAARFAPFDMTTATIVEPQIVFSPVPHGTRWQVLVAQETTVHHLITIEHDDLDVAHDPHDLTALQEAIRARALHQLGDGAATEFAVEHPPLEITSWEIHSSAGAAEALTHITQYAAGTDD